MYISFHSYSQLCLFPFGHSHEHAPNYNDLVRHQFDWNQFDKRIWCHITDFQSLFRNITFQKQIGLKAKEGIAKRYGTSYTVGSIAEAICKFVWMKIWIEIDWCLIVHFSLYSWIYLDLASGSSIDWVYAKQNVNLTYTFEFRDKGNVLKIHSDSLW